MSTYQYSDIVNAQRQGYCDGRTVAAQQAGAAPLLSQYQLEAAQRYPLMQEVPNVMTDPEDPTIQWQLTASGLEMNRTTDTLGWRAPEAVVPTTRRLAQLQQLRAQPTVRVPITG